MPAEVLSPAPRLWPPRGGCVARQVGGGLWAVPDSVPLFPSTSAVSRPRWTLTTRPRTPAPGAASTRSSATTVWPSRALPAPSGRGCRRPPSSTSPSRPRPRAIRGQPAFGRGAERWGPPLAEPSSSYNTVLGDVGAGRGRGRRGSPTLPLAGVGGAWASVGGAHPHCPSLEWAGRGPAWAGLTHTAPRWSGLNCCFLSSLVLWIRPRVRLMYKGMFRVDRSHVRYFQSHCLFIS